MNVKLLLSAIAAVLTVAVGTYTAHGQDPGEEDPYAGWPDAWLTLSASTETTPTPTPIPPRTVVDVSALRNTLHGLPWYTDGLDQWEQWAVDNVNHFLDSYRSTNRQLASRLINAEWFQIEGIDSDKAFAVGAMGAIVHDHRPVLPMLLKFDWAFDGDFTLYERAAVNLLKDLERFYPSAGEGRAFGRLPWVIDGISYPEWIVVLTITRLENRGPNASTAGAGVWLLNLPWVVDGISPTEDLRARGAGSLYAIARDFDQDFKELHDLIAGGSEASFLSIQVMTVLGTLHQLATYDIQEVEQRASLRTLETLLNADWFQDGLTNEERVHIIGFHEDTRELLNPAHTLVRHRAVDLPLAGVVNLWVAERRAFSRTDLLQTGEEGLRGAEGVMGAPFPHSDFVITLVRGRYASGWVRGYSGISHGRGERTNIVSWYSDAFVREVVYHEVAHAYFRGAIGPWWLVEGGAELVTAHILDSLRYSRIAEGPRLESAYRRDCTSRGVFQVHEAWTGDVAVGCRYTIAHYFLFKLKSIIGQEALYAAMRDRYLTRLTGGDNTDAKVYEAILAHTPPARVDAVRELYERLHGGEFLE